MFFLNTKIKYLPLLTLLIILTAGCKDVPKNEAGPPPFPIVTFEHLLGVATPDSDHIWIVGLNSTILHSSDKGKTWLPQKSPPEMDLYDVCFVDHQNGWAVGKHGMTVRTEDGGREWVKEKTLTDQRLFDVHFVDKKTGWTVGSWGTILHTEDGGKTWEKQGSGEDLIYNGVWFVDNRKGWIVGEYGNIYHTEDGGVNWVRQQCKDIIPVVREDEWETPTPSLYGVYFQNQNKGWAVGLDGIIIFTEDRGNYWKKLESPTEFSLYKIMVIDNNGWAVGSRGGYISSTDGGYTWTLNEGAIKTRFWLRDLAFSDKLHGWVVGSSGTIAYTVDGGKTWKRSSGISID
jgi:photosystem II stability/assembly factor-like uncharacterized protein